MIEKIILDYLTDTLGVPCYMEVPADPETTFIVIEKTGGSQADHLRSVTIAIQSYADSLFNAANLNIQVITAMYGSIELSAISECRLNSDYNFTDTTSKKYRYQAVFDIIYYE